MIANVRNIRPSKAMGLTADSVVRAALLSELVVPIGEARTLWMVSGWISDVSVIDNSNGSYDALLGDEFPPICRLSHILGAIHRRGTTVHVVTQPQPRHMAFVEQLRRTAGHDPEPRIAYGEVAHEKTLCTNSWLIEGSMNFTYSGLGVNDESVNYTVDPAKIGKALIDFSTRWGSK